MTIDPFEDEGDLGLWPPPPERTWDEWLQMDWQSRSKQVETVPVEGGRL